MKKTILVLIAITIYLSSVNAQPFNDLLKSTESDSLKASITPKDNTESSRNEVQKGSIIKIYEFFDYSDRLMNFLFQCWFLIVVIAFSILMFLWILRLIFSKKKSETNNLDTFTNKNYLAIIERMDRICYLLQELLNFPRPSNIKENESQEALKCENTETHNSPTVPVLKNSKTILNEIGEEFKRQFNDFNHYRNIGGITGILNDLENKYEGFKFQVISKYLGVLKYKEVDFGFLIPYSEHKTQRPQWETYIVHYENFYQKTGESSGSIFKIEKLAKIREPLLNNDPKDSLLEMGSLIVQ
jgi:hypothetical protein